MAEARSSEKECEKYEITRIMFRLIYAEVKLNIPLYHHTDLVKLFKMANVNMGFHHYERRSAQRIVDHISFEMRTDLIKGIKHSQRATNSHITKRKKKLFLHLYSIL